MSRKYRAPQANGAVLADPGFDAVPAQVEANRNLLEGSNTVIGGRPLRDLRVLARREIVELATEWIRDRDETRRTLTDRTARTLPSGQHSLDAPLLLTGHQPELSHPGVWVKNFALNGLAATLNGIPLNLIVDSDTLKSATLQFPTFRNSDPGSVRLESLAFDAFAGEVPYEAAAISDEAMFRSFAKRAATLFANWGYEPLLPTAWPEALQGTPRVTIAERFTAMRRACEIEWGCRNLELPVSRLAQSQAFARFAQHILADLRRFRDIYNAAIRQYRAANGIRSANHPAPELAQGEAPFWVRETSSARVHASAASDVRTLRPRALTLTIFTRVFIGDYFIHGIGGGKYDEVADAVIRDYFGIEPPAFQVLSATLHLPLPGYPSTNDDLRRAERMVRDLHWNPQRYIRPEQRGMIDAYAALTQAEPAYRDHAARREWFRAFHALKQQLRPLVAEQVIAAAAEVERVRSEVIANAILQRRDFPWPHYPVTFLKRFLQRFLNQRQMEE